MGQKNFTNYRGIGLAMRSDPLHGILDREKFLAGAIKRPNAGASRTDECLVDVEE